MDKKSSKRSVFMSAPTSPRFSRKEKTFEFPPSSPRGGGGASFSSPRTSEEGDVEAEEEFDTTVHLRSVAILFGILILSLVTGIVLMVLAHPHVHKRDAALAAYASAHPCTTTCGKANNCATGRGCCINGAVVYCSKEFEADMPSVEMGWEAWFITGMGLVFVIGFFFTITLLLWMFGCWDMYRWQKQYGQNESAPTGLAEPLINGDWREHE
eukprot:TRINITY_DN54706_c0_g1_i1.p1 TRINITY_DN54706_c0_g1~~TRINITY_DN54706_c0_g1_i1.p1  ORF type:complete len:212 (+),score=28.98 TRINITY_DN54706_c0_g1_i1:222-857(+)